MKLTTKYEEKELKDVCYQKMFKDGADKIYGRLENRNLRGIRNKCFDHEVTVLCVQGTSGKTWSFFQKLKHEKICYTLMKAAWLNLAINNVVLNRNFRIT